MSVERSQYASIPATGPYAWPGPTPTVESVEDLVNLLQPVLEDVGASVEADKFGLLAHLPNGRTVSIVLTGEPGEIKFDQPPDSRRIRVAIAYRGHNDWHAIPINDDPLEGCCTPEVAMKFARRPDCPSTHECIATIDVPACKVAEVAATTEVPNG